MEGWMIALAIKPLALVAFFFVIRCASEELRFRLRDSLLKRVLYYSWRV